MTPHTDTVQGTAEPAKVAQKRARWRRYGLPAAVVAAAIALFAAGYYGWDYFFGDDAASAEVVTAVAVRGNLEDVVTATGTLQPKEFVDVGTQVSGQLRMLHVDVGAVVKKGQLLAEIDPSVYQSKVDADRAQMLNQTAQMADRQAQLVLAEAQLKRQQNLMRESATSTDALQVAEAARNSALAQVNSMRAQIQQTESTLRGDMASLGYTKIYAPISGTVVSLSAKQGQTLNANQSAPIVLRIADLATMTVQAQVSEADVPKLHIGMDVYFTTLGGDGRRYYGKLRQIPPTPTVVNNVVLYDALFDVDNPSRTLMTQMTAQVFFVVASARDAVIVPLTALHSIGGPGRGGPRRQNREGATADASKADASKADPSKSANTEAQPGTGERRRERRAAAEGQASGGKGGGDRAASTDPRARFARGTAMVTVVGPDGKRTEREVRVGVMTRVSAQILSGLEPGEIVVIGTKQPAGARTKTAPAKSALVPSPGGGRGGGGLR
jgi:macrolide-specific efflux system membrane fusion protein